MRASVGGRYDLSGLKVKPAMRLGDPGDYDREPRVTAEAWRFCAVQLGGVEALLAKTRDGLSEEARGDPVRCARFADAVLAMRTACFWIAEAARCAAEDCVEATEFAELTRGVVERAALDVMEASDSWLCQRSPTTGATTTTWPWPWRPNGGRRGSWSAVG